MADRPNPYVRKDPGDIIRSGDWNELQVRAREEIRSHRHSGGDDGLSIPRAGIEEKAIDGSRIDPTAEVNLKNLTLSGALKVSGKLTLGDVDDLLPRFKSLESDKLNRAGDTITGSLSVKQTLSVNSSIGVGTTAPPKEPLEVNGRIQSGALTIGPWPANPGNYVFFGTNALNQADAANYALLQCTTGGDLGMTFLNSSKNIRFRIGNGDRMVLNKDRLDVNVDLNITGRQNIFKIKAFRDIQVQNGGIDKEGSWKISFSGEFAEVYTVFAILQGHSLSPSISPGQHWIDANAIPQVIYVKVSNYDNNGASGIAYCSESKKEYEGDNNVLFTLVVIGRGVLPG